VKSMPSRTHFRTSVQRFIGQFLVNPRGSGFLQFQSKSRFKKGNIVNGVTHSRSSFWCTMINNGADNGLKRALWLN
jgi:hypothetical protein